MVLRFYNTLTRKKEDFVPIDKNKVNMFVCGPTVYDYSHIGHARTYLAFDFIARYLKFKKYEVFYLQNITDIDDRIIERANNREASPGELAKQFTEEYFSDMRSLRISSVSKYAPATEYLAEIITQIKTLVEKGYAYETSDGVYYRVSMFEDYGKLSGQDLSKLKVGMRVSEDKENPEDFALWKKAKPGEPIWESPWGQGRPGWHIEDTAITETHFGPQYDIHGGAKDLIFPHHEAEIAQIEAASGKKPLVRYWMHTGFLNVSGQKMSKSLGNFITIRDALRKWDVDTMRFFVASTHYRSAIDFSESNINSSAVALSSLKNTFLSLKEISEKNYEADDTLLRVAFENSKNNFFDALDEDFNAPEAFASIFALQKEINKSEKISSTFAKELLCELTNWFGIFGIFEGQDERTLTKDQRELVDEREKARKEKNWELSDKIRDQLKAQGIIIQDSSEGTKIRFE